MDTSTAKCSRLTEIGQMAAGIMAYEKAKAKGKVRKDNGENSILLRDEGIQITAPVTEGRPNPSPERECGSASGRQQSGDRASLASSPFTTQKLMARSPSSCSSTTEPLSSSQHSNIGEDCAEIVLKCLYCRFYDMLLMLPHSCERAAYHCCPTYVQVSTTLESTAGNGSTSSIDCDCGLLDACNDISDCIELAMEMSEMCYH